MRKILVQSGLLLAAGLLVATFVLAQDQGLRVGSGDEAVSSAAVLEELRSIHEQLGALLERLEEAPSEGTGVERLERRVAALERQVRGQEVRRAREELQSLRAEFDEDGDRERITGEVERLRTDLQRAFADGEGRDVDWEATGRELTTTLDALAEQLGGDEDPNQAFEEALGGLETVAETIRTAQPAEAEEEPEAEEADAEEEAEAPFEWETQGPQVYAENCAACHQANGQGVAGAFPPLAGNEFVTGDPGPVIDVVLHGRGGMPSFSSLSDGEVAAVISHERNAWDNEASVITPDMVETVRAGEMLEEAGARPGAAD